MDIFFKKGIDTKTQYQINMRISDLVNEGQSDEVIFKYLENYHYSPEEAKRELKKAKLFMGWYANKKSRDL